LKRQLPGGKWAYSQTFEEVAAAVEMKIPPSEFYSWSKTDRAMVVGFFRAKELIRGYDDHVREEEMKRTRKSRKHG